jgi:hypothetical protein
MGCQADIAEDFGFNNHISLLRKCKTKGWFPIFLKKVEILSKKVMIKPPLEPSNYTLYVTTQV